MNRKDENGRGKGLFKSEYHDYDFVGVHARYISFCSREKTRGGLKIQVEAE